MDVKFYTMQVAIVSEVHVIVGIKYLHGRII